MTWLEQQRAFEARARSCEVAGAVKRHAEAIVDTGAAGAGGDRGSQGLCRGSGVADAILQLGAMLVHEGVVEEITVVRHVLGQEGWKPRRIANVRTSGDLMLTVGLLDDSQIGSRIVLGQDGTAPVGRAKE